MSDAQKKKQQNNERIVEFNISANALIHNIDNNHSSSLHQDITRFINSLNQLTYDEIPQSNRINYIILMFQKIAANTSYDFANMVSNITIHTILHAKLMEMGAEKYVKIIETLYDLYTYTHEQVLKKVPKNLQYKYIVNNDDGTKSYLHPCALMLMTHYVPKTYNALKRDGMILNKYTYICGSLLPTIYENVVEPDSEFSNNVSMIFDIICQLKFDIKLDRRKDYLELITHATTIMYHKYGLYSKTNIDIDFYRTQISKLQNFIDKNYDKCGTDAAFKDVIDDYVCIVISNPFNHSADRRVCYDLINLIHYNGYKVFMIHPNTAYDNEHDKDIDMHECIGGITSEAMLRKIKKYKFQTVFYVNSICHLTYMCSILKMGVKQYLLNGNPMTTGLTNVFDGCLVSPFENKAYYTEQPLIELEPMGCSMSYFEIELTDNKEFVDRHKDTFTILCPWSTYKYNYDLMDTLKTIYEKSDKKPLFVFYNMEGAQVSNFNIVLNNYIIKMPENSYELGISGFVKYYEYIRDCDLVLSSFPYGGLMTALDALSIKTPIVSLCGPLEYNNMDNYANMSTGKLMQELKYDKYVAKSKDSFVELVVDLINDKEGLYTKYNETLKKDDIKKSIGKLSDRYIGELSKYLDDIIPITKSRKKQLKKLAQLGELGEQDVKQDELDEQNEQNEQDDESDDESEKMPDLEDEKSDLNNPDDPNKKQ